MKYAIEFHTPINHNSVGHLHDLLNKLPEKVIDLLVLISSPGGDNVASRAAYSALVNLPPNIVLSTCGCGTIDSSAVTLFCAGSRRTCLPHTRFQLHQAGWDINERVDHRRAREIADILQSDDRSHAIVIAAAMGRTTDEVHALIQHGTVWDANQAKTEGLVHEITGLLPHLLDGRTVHRIFNVQG